MAKSLCQAWLAILIAAASCAAGAENLNQAWEAALVADHGLKARRESTAAASEQLAAAKAVRLPGLSLEAGYTTQADEPALKFAGTEVAMAQRNSAGYKAVASVPLYTGGRIARGIDAASSAVQAAQTREKTGIQDLKLQIADAYVGVLRAERLLRVANSHVLSLEAHARDVENLRRQGLVVKNAALASQVALLDARQRQLQASNGLELARSAYNRALGRALDERVELSGIAPGTTAESLADLTERALAQRSELAELDHLIEALRSQSAAIRGENRPQIGLSTAYGYQQNRYMAHEGAWSATLGVSWNVFDGGVVRSRASSSDRQAAALIEQRDDLRSLIRLQTRQAWLDMQESRQRTRVSEAAIAQAEENLRVTRDRYTNGLVSHTEVLDAETLRLGSEINHANAVFDAAMAELKLKRAINEL